MGIHSLTVSGLSLEVPRKGLPVDVPIAGYGISGRALGEDAQKWSLFFECVSLV